MKRERKMRPLWDRAISAAMSAFLPNATSPQHAYSKGFEAGWRAARRRKARKA